MSSSQMNNYSNQKPGIKVDVRKMGNFLSPKQALHTSQKLKEDIKLAQLNNKEYASILAQTVKSQKFGSQKQSLMNSKEFDSIYNTMENNSPIKTKQTYESDEEEHGRSLQAEIDYANPKKAMKQIKEENLQKIMDIKRKQTLNFRKIKDIEDQIAITQNNGVATNQKTTGRSQGPTMHSMRTAAVTNASRASRTSNISRNQNKHEGGSDKKSVLFNKLISPIEKQAVSNSVEKITTRNTSLDREYDNLAELLVVDELMQQAVNEIRKKDGQNPIDFITLQLAKASGVNSNWKISLMRDKYFLTLDQMVQALNNIKDQVDINSNERLKQSYSSLKGIREKQQITQFLDNYEKRDYLRGLKMQQKNRYFPQISQQLTGVDRVGNSVENLRVPPNNMAINGNQLNFRGQDQINEKQGTDNVVFNALTPHSGNWLPKKQGCFNDSAYVEKTFDKRVNHLDKNGVAKRPNQQNVLPAGIRVPRSFKLTIPEKIPKIIQSLQASGASPEEIQRHLERKHSQANQRYGNRSTVGYLIDMQDTSPKVTMSISSPGEATIKKRNANHRSMNVRQTVPENQLIATRMKLDQDSYKRKVLAKEVSEYNRQKLLNNQNHMLNHVKVYKNNHRNTRFTSTQQPQYLHTLNASFDQGTQRKSIEPIKPFGDSINHRTNAASLTIYNDNMNPPNYSNNTDRYITMNQELHPEKPLPSADFTTYKKNFKRKSVFQQWSDAMYNNNVFFNPPVNGI